MSRRRTLGVALVVAICAIAAVATGLVLTSSATHAAKAAKPDRVGKPLDKRYMDRDSASALAGRGGEPAGGESEAEGAGRSTADYEGEKYLDRALPALQVSRTQMDTSHATFDAYKENKDGSSGTTNVNKPFLWDLVGPTQALQPDKLSFSGAPLRMAGRTTALALVGKCTANSSCRLYAAAAGGGIWRTDNPLSPDPKWFFVSQSFASNAIGDLVADPTDASGNTVYAGTGEPNQSGDSASGVGIYKTTNGGATWTLLPGSAQFATRSISEIVVDPGNSSHLLAAVARGVQGVSSVTGGGVSRTAPCNTFPPPGGCGDGPDQAPLGLYESNDGGATFHLIWDGGNALRGVNDAAIDPNNGGAIYASAFQRGIWRCAPQDGCDPATATPADFQQVFKTANAQENTARTQFALTTIPSGTQGAAAGTRIYAVDGSTGPAFVGDPPNQQQVAFPAHVWRADGANTMTAAELLASEGDPQTRPPSPNSGAGWAKKSSNTSRPASNPYRPAYNSCTGQCWYDEDIYTPAGFPNVVYVLGSYQYTELRERSNGRGVLLSTSAGDPDPAIRGGNFSDLTWDDTSHSQPSETHPDQHAIVTAAGQPFLYFEGSDGGIVRSDGSFDDASDDCLQYHFNDADTLVHCQRVLSRVPHQVYDDLNKGLSTLQYQSVSVSPERPLNDIQGGTQDNGTFDWDAQISTWKEEMYGDGGQSGYNYCNASIRFNQFFSPYTDENFRNGQILYWVVQSGPLFAAPGSGAPRENVAFYPPEVTDYTNCGPSSNYPQFQTQAAIQQNANFAKNANGDLVGPGRLGASLGFQFYGMQHIWRTVDNGGPQDYLEANCPEFTTAGSDPRCGDWKPLGDTTGEGRPGTPGDLTSEQYGTDKTGVPGVASYVAAVERNPGNANELWAATRQGRVFVSFNANAVDPASVQFCRIDQFAPNSPPRFVSSIYPDPNNPNRAWLSYDGYNSNTKDQPGHVFEVTFDGPTASGSACPTVATWRDLHVEQGTVGLQGGIPQGGDIPITDLVRDDFAGDLYASTDYGVLRGQPAANNEYVWTRADKAGNFPMVETPGLTIDPCTRLLYAATHGRSVWRMFLPSIGQNLKACPRTP